MGIWLFCWFTKKKKKFDHSDSHLPTHPSHFRFISSHCYSPFVMRYFLHSSHGFLAPSSSSSSRLRVISSPSSSSYLFYLIFLNLTIPSVLLIFFASFSDLLHHFLFLLFFFSLQIHAKISDQKANFFTDMRLNRLTVWTVFQVRPRSKRFSHIV